MTRVLHLTRAWAAITGLLLIAFMIVLMALGQTVSYALPMLVSGIVGYEAALIAHDYWRRRRHG